MMMQSFEDRLALLQAEHEALIRLPNSPVYPGNGIFLRYRTPVITAAHTPLDWR